MNQPPLVTGLLLEPSLLPGRAPPFAAEVLVSAGPQKRPAAYEQEPENAQLCEDCAGLCWTGTLLAFWLCDGASNQFVFPRLRQGKGDNCLGPAALGFSARLLAQDLGQAFVRAVSQALISEAEVSPDLPARAFAGLASSWEQRLAAYVAKVWAKGFTDALLATLPGNGRLSWAATFTGGLFDPLTGTLTLWNCGDAGGLVMTTPPAVVLPRTDPVIFSATIRAQEAGIGAQVSLLPLADMHREFFTGVEGFAIVSDGLDRHNIGVLLQRLSERTYTSLMDLRHDLLSGAPLTWDDKSAVFGCYLR